MNLPRPHDLAERTQLFAVCMLKLYPGLPEVEEAGLLRQELLRSATSLGLLYVDAKAGHAKPLFIEKIGDCLKEAGAAAYWLDLLVESGLRTEPPFLDLQNEAHQLVAILHKVWKNAQGKL
jgi:four helix bundle protein